jgi:two-component system nitrate/nitrite response regulator NarL
VLALTALEEPGSVREALRLGFQGYLTKDISIRQFVDAVRTALDGQVVVSRRSAPAVVGERPSPIDRVGRLAEHLTGREREVLSLIVEGAGSREISSRLHIAPNTVRTHVQSILTKLQVHSRLEAAAFAVRHGLVELEPSRRYA